LSARVPHELDVAEDDVDVGPVSLLSKTRVLRATAMTRGTHLRKSRSYLASAASDTHLKTT
jgi:hypothetical protein